MMENDSLENQFASQSLGIDEKIKAAYYEKKANELRSKVCTIHNQSATVDVVDGEFRLSNSCCLAFTQSLHSVIKGES